MTRGRRRGCFWMIYIYTRRCTFLPSLSHLCWITTYLDSQSSTVLPYFCRYAFSLSVFLYSSIANGCWPSLISWNMFIYQMSNYHTDQGMSWGRVPTRACHNVWNLWLAPIWQFFFVLSAVKNWIFVRILLTTCIILFV